MLCIVPISHSKQGSAGRNFVQGVAKYEITNRPV